MPIYEYQAANPQTACPRCKQPFQVTQAVTDPPLAKCPYCGTPLIKLISTPAKPHANILSPKNLADHGFTQYKRSGKGCYEKTAGEGPQTLHDPQKR